MNDEIRQTYKKLGAIEAYNNVNDLMVSEAQTLASLFESAINNHDMETAKIYQIQVNYMADLSTRILKIARNAKD